MTMLRTFVDAEPAAFPDGQRSLAGPLCPAFEAARPHIGLLVLFGPEVRAFLYSGLAARLARHGRVSVITTNPASAAFSRLGDGAVQAAPREAPPHAVRRLRGWNRRLQDAWMNTQGESRWRNQPPPGLTASGPVPRTVRPGTGCPLWLRNAHQLERSLSFLSGGGKDWKSLCQRLGLDCLVAADYASPAASMALAGAARNHVATVVLTNSWKDVYAHPNVDTPPDWIGVPGQPEADHLRRSSPHLRAGRIAVVGSLHLERFLKPGGIPDRAEFCAQAGLDPARPFICYTAASPQAVCGEQAIVAALLETVAHHPARPQVLLRLNPREDGERFRALRARFSHCVSRCAPHCVVQRPRWEWDAANDWNAPLPEDLETWIATVHHAAFNVSIPSTVTLEFAAMGRLTLNVCFDAAPQPPGASNARYWDAPFYRQIRTSPLVAGAFSAAEFRALLDCRLSEPGAWRLSPRRCAASPVEEAEKLVCAALAAKTGSRPRDAWGRWRLSRLPS